MRILSSAEPRAVLDPFLEAFGVEPCAVLDHGWADALHRQAVGRLRSAEASGELRPNSLVFFTSGSTGRPRAVHRSARSWADSLDVFTELVGVRRETPVWLPGPLHSTLFLFGAWHARSVGAPVVTAGEDPSEAVVMHAVPAMLSAVVDRVRRGDLPRLRTIVVAGDRMPAGLADRVRDVVPRLVEYYGAAELSLVAARDDDGPFRAVPGVETRVVDGVLWSRSPFQAHGYLGGQDGPLRRTPDGWATVGDLARLHEDGFVVLGRGDAAVTTGGHTVVAEDVESFLRGVPGVRDAAVVGLPHSRLGQRVVAVVVTVPDGPDDATLREAVQALPRAARPRAFLRRDVLPRTGAGKLRRADLVTQLVAEHATDPGDEQASPNPDGTPMRSGALPT